VSFDQYAPYGSVVESSLRVVTWNVWGRYGQWQERQAAIEESLAVANPDVVCLIESWSNAETTQAELVAERLGFAHHVFAGDWDQGDWVSGTGLVSRWPLEIVERRKLRGEDDSGMGEALAVTIGGDRGPVQFFAVMLDYPLGASDVRQAQVRQLAKLISSTTHRRHLILVCGDFNAGPDSDEPGPIAIHWRRSLSIQIDDSTTCCRRGRDLEGWGIPPIASSSVSYRKTSSNSRTTTESSPTSGTDSTPKGSLPRDGG
jgi:exonuclease III